MQNTFLFWRVLVVLAVTILTGSCSTTPSRVKTEESVQIETRNAPVVSRQARPDTKPAPPKIISTGELIDHKFFVINYDRKYRLARWVKYTMTREQLRSKRAKRRDKFRADPMMTDPDLNAVSPREYVRTGYDKGHLAPSADFAFSQEANDATFVMSNMAPQKPKLNRVAWRLLEEQVRRWACGEERVTVITGPILEGELPRLPSGLPIPKEFFKVVIDQTAPLRAKAFVYRQEDAQDVLPDREVDLGALDRRLHENFSAYLPAENRAPAQSASEPWRECVL